MESNKVIPMHSTISLMRKVYESSMERDRWKGSYEMTTYIYEAKSTRDAK